MKNIIQQTAYLNIISSKIPPVWGRTICECDNIMRDYYILAYMRTRYRTPIPSHIRGRQPANSRCPPVKLLLCVVCRQLLLGHRYGSRPVPSAITSKEFQLLRDVVKCSEADVTLLDTWYKCDENALPPEYILQPISSILTNYCNKVSLSPLLFGQLHCPILRNTLSQHCI